ncbi:MAG: YraN family protein [Alphaproteobacteria bacterium]|nr:YraN family protein [Alphaproteobacteria bacterium]
MPSNAKLAAVDRGRIAERRAVWLLRLKLYRVLAVNFRPARASGLGEVDIIARKGRTLVFIEVKARATEDGAIDAIAPAQQQRIARTAQHFLKRRPRYAGAAMRFDAMVLEAGRFWPRHVIDAFRP